MRTLIVYGCIGLYILAAFVPPTDVNLRAQAKQASEAVTQTVVSTLQQKNLALPAVTAAASAVKKLSSYIPADVQVGVTSAINTAAEKALTVAISSEKQQWAKEQLKLIEWAGKKADVRACENFRTVTAPESTAAHPATPGDYLAYCLARTSREPARCEQIHTEISPDLRTLCTNEFRASI